MTLYDHGEPDMTLSEANRDAQYLSAAYSQQEADLQWEFENRFAPFATQSEAHAEWHRNSGVPMGTPGCPQDACHPVDDYEEPTVKCGNKAVHGKDGEISYPYHYSPAEVRECYAGSGRFAGTQPAAEAVSEGVWHSTGPKVEEGHWESKCPGARYCVVAALPQVSVEQAVATARQMEAEQTAQHAAAVAAQQEQARKEAAKVRYQMWASIPVYSRNCGYYALVVDGKTHFYRVERPTKGKHAGRTFASEQASDTFYKMSWAGQGAALDAIAVDPQGAARLYAEKIEKCSRCNRTLTDDDSIARGIGPDCAQKYGA